MPRHAGFRKRKYRLEESEMRRGSPTSSIICRGEAEVSCVETIYPPVPIVGHDLMFCEHRPYEKMAGRVFYRGTAAQRRYEETI